MGLGDSLAENGANTVANFAGRNSTNSEAGLRLADRILIYQHYLLVDSIVYCVEYFLSYEVVL